jgi:hypothetical protein
MKKILTIPGMTSLRWSRTNLTTPDFSKNSLDLEDFGTVIIWNFLKKVIGRADSSPDLKKEQTTTCKNSVRDVHRGFRTQRCNDSPSSRGLSELMDTIFEEEDQADCESDTSDSGDDDSTCESDGMFDRMCSSITKDISNCRLDEATAQMDNIRSRYTPPAPLSRSLPTPESRFGFNATRLPTPTRNECNDSSQDVVNDPKLLLGRLRVSMDNFKNGACVANGEKPPFVTNQNNDSHMDVDMDISKTSTGFQTAHLSKKNSSPKFLNLASSILFGRSN